MSREGTVEDPRFIAAIKLLRRTGLRSFQVRYSDDEEPVIWMAVGEWSVDRQGRPVPRGGQQYYEAAAAADPLRAVLRLADQMMDGGKCRHCGRTSGVTDDWRRSMPLSDVVCWYVFDPEIEEYRRSCEGETS